MGIAVYRKIHSDVLRKLLTRSCWIKLLPLTWDPMPSTHWIFCNLMVIGFYTRRQSPNFLIYVKNSLGHGTKGLNISFKRRCTLLCSVVTGSCYNSSLVVMSISALQLKPKKESIEYDPGTQRSPWFSAAVQYSLVPLIWCQSHPRSSPP